MSAVRRRTAVIVAVALALVLGVAATAAAAPELITFGNVTCAPSWPPPNPGRDAFQVVNQSSRAATVYLFRADSGRIVATVTGLKSGYVAAADGDADPGPVRLGLRPGRVPAPCLRGRQGHRPPTGRRHRSRRRTGATERADRPAAQLPLVCGRHRSRRSSTQVGALRTAVDAGSLAAAESAWLAAHLTWLSIGQDDGAYGAFGELGRADRRHRGRTRRRVRQARSSPAFTSSSSTSGRVHDLPAAQTDAARARGAGRRPCRGCGWARCCRRPSSG